MADTKDAEATQMEVAEETTPTPPVAQPQPAAPVQTTTEDKTVKTTPKRMYVQADDMDTEIPDKKRGRMELDKPQRDLVLRYILAAHVRLAMKMTHDNANKSAVLTNLHLSQQVTSIFGTIHNCLRQESLNIGSLKSAMESRSHCMTSSGDDSKEVKHTELKDMIKELAKSFGLIYSRPKNDDNNHWYGTVSPILCFINMFKVRLS